MRAEEFIAKLSEKTTENEAEETLKKGLPLGLDMAGEVVLSQTVEHLSSGF